MEDKEQGAGGEQNRKKTSVITIPSYEEVLQSSNSKSNPPSLFVPSQTFSQAFSYLKSSEFYSPPPTTASAPSSSFNASQTSQPPESSAFRQVGQNDAAASTSTYAVPPTPAAKSTFPTSNSNQNRNTILVSHRQKGNPLLKHIRNVKWEFADVVCDYLLGQSSCVLYLSVRYHLLHPDYLYYRIRELQKNFKLRVVLCHIDVEDVVKPLLEVTKTALLHDCTLLCGWSLEECGRYLETIKVYENKPADLIQGQMDTDYLSRLTHALTTVRHVNKTDVVTLGTTFGSLSHIMDASMEDLARCPGIGERKVKRLYDTFHEPFKRIDSARPAIPETPAQNHAVFSTADEKQDEQDINQHRKKEPDLTVKSALSVAFARYADKVGKNSVPKEDKGGETSFAKEADIDRET